MEVTWLLVNQVFQRILILSNRPILILILLTPNFVIAHPPLSMDPLGVRFLIFPVLMTSSPWLCWAPQAYPLLNYPSIAMPNSTSYRMRPGTRTFVLKFRIRMVFAQKLFMLLWEWSCAAIRTLNIKMRVCRPITDGWRLSAALCPIGSLVWLNLLYYQSILPSLMSSVQKPRAMLV